MRAISKASIAKAYIQVVPTTTGISSTLSSSMGGAGNAAGKSSGMKFISAFKNILVTAGLGKALSSAISEGAAMQQSLGGVETLFGKHADIVKQNARDAYISAGLSANEYMETVTGFSASLLQSLGGDTLKASKIADTALRDMSDNANKFGSDMESLKNAYQGFAKGNYTMLDNLKLGYGGSATEMARLINDSGVLGDKLIDLSDKANIGAALQKVGYAKMLEAIHVLQTEMGVTGTTAKEASATISGSLASMKASFSNVLADLSLGNDLKPSLTALTDTVVVFGKNNLLPALKNILSTLPVMLTTLIVGLGPEIAPAAIEIISSLCWGLIKNLPSLVSAVGEVALGIVEMMTSPDTISRLMINTAFDIITSLCNGLIANLPSLIPGVVGIVMSIVELLTAPDTITELLPVAVDLIMALADGLIQSLPLLIESVPVIIENVVQSLASGIGILVSGAVELFSAIVQAIPIVIPMLVKSIPVIVQSVTDCLIDNLPLLIQSGVQLLFALNTGILEALPELLAMLPEIIAAMVETLVMYLPQMLKMGVQLLTSLGTGVMSYVGELVARVKDVGSRVIEVFKGLPDKFVSVGKNLVSGLWQGISGSYTWIKNKISGWVGDVLSFLKNLFGIHSPSTKTAYQGKMLGMGLAKGIIGSKSEVFKAVRGITKMTTGSFETGLSVRAVGASASHSFGAAASSVQAWPDVTNEIRALGDRIEHMQVSLDSKKVVGGIVTDMRYELGLQETMAKRGVIK